MKFVLTSLATIATLAACTTTPLSSTIPAAETKFVCPSTGGELDNFKTEKQVISCLGKPRHETSQPDGRHTGLYGFSGGLTIVFLYDESGNVIRNRAYKDGN